VGSVSYANLPANVEYSAGDMIINLNGSSWEHVKNTTRWASKTDAEVGIDLLKNDGVEKTEGSVTNVKVLSPLRALQQLLKNRLASLFQLRDDTDETKKIKFLLSGITTGETRTITIPDEDITLVGENRIGARPYSDTEKYLLNQSVIKDGVIWRNITAITTPEAFDRTKWSFVSNANSWQSISSSANTIPFGRYTADTSGGAFDLTLPLNPQNGDTVEIKDGKDFSTNALTILRNGQTILKQTQDLIIDVENATVVLLFTGGTWTVEFDTPKTVD